MSLWGGMINKEFYSQFLIEDKTVDIAANKPLHNYVNHRTEYAMHSDILKDWNIRDIKAKKELKHSYIEIVSG